MGTTFFKARQRYFIYYFVRLFTQYLGACSVAGVLAPGSTAQNKTNTHHRLRAAYVIMAETNKK